MEWKKSENFSNMGHADSCIKVNVLRYNLNKKKMAESNCTAAQIDNGEIVYYKELQKHINCLGEKFREKSVIKQSVYNDIVKCLSLPKGKPSGLFSPKFIYWVKKHCV